MNVLEKLAPTQCHERNVVLIGHMLQYQLNRHQVTSVKVCSSFSTFASFNFSCDTMYVPLLSELSFSVSKHKIDNDLIEKYSLSW